MTHEKYPDAHHDAYSKTIFGFWLYLVTDFMLFATVFAAYAVLNKSTFGGPSGRVLFDLPFTLTQTLIMLTSSFTVGLAGAAAHRRLKGWTLTLFAVTFFLGVAFMGMQFDEFSRYIAAGSSWKKSAFLSSYFTATGIYGLHMVLGLLWMIVLIIPVCFEGVSPVSIRRLTCLRMFWQFLNIVWGFIFIIIYLLGVA